MEELKRQAAARALEEVRNGMKLGLGTGSTAKHFVDLLGERVRAGLDVIGVPTSEVTRAQAERCGIRLTTLDDIDRLDRMIVIADDSKWVDVLGRFPLPIEVIPFGLAATQRAMARAFAESGVSGQMLVRNGKDGHVFV